MPPPPPPLPAASAAPSAIGTDSSPQHSAASSPAPPSSHSHVEGGGGGTGGALSGDGLRSRSPGPLPERPASQFRRHLRFHCREPSMPALRRLRRGAESRRSCCGCGWRLRRRLPRRRRLLKVVEHRHLGGDRRQVVLKVGERAAARAPPLLRPRRAQATGGPVAEAVVFAATHGHEPHLRVAVLALRDLGAIALCCLPIDWATTAPSSSGARASAGGVVSSRGGQGLPWPSDSRRVSFGGGAGE